MRAKLQKTMLNYYLAQLGVHQSEFGFPFLATERNYIAANLELSALGAFGDLVLAGWVRAVPKDVESALASGVQHLNLSMSTSDQIIVHKFKGKLDRESILRETTQAVEMAVAWCANRGCECGGRLAHRLGLPDRVRADR